MSVPRPILLHALHNRMIPQLRTFCGIKYCIAKGNGRSFVDTSYLAEVLDCTQQTIRNHVADLFDRRWLWADKKNPKVWYCRGWKKVLKYVDEDINEEDRTGVAVVRTTTTVLGTKVQFQAFITFCFLHQNLKQQGFQERKKSKGIAKNRAVIPFGEISCKRLAELYKVSERVASMYRRQMADFGLYSMYRHWVEFPPDVPKEYLRQMEEHDRILFFLPSGFILSPLLSSLIDIDDTIINIRARKV